MRMQLGRLATLLALGIGSTLGAQDRPSGPIRLSGTVEAVRIRAIQAPRLAGQTLGNLVITQLVSPGQHVTPGDLIVEFDRQDQLRAAFDRRAELLDLAEQISKKTADQTAARAKDETELKQAENDVERARLEMRKNELLPRVEAEKNTLALEQAEARLTQLKTTFDLKRVAAAADLRILEIRQERAQRALRYAEQNSSLMEVRAPFEGLAVIRTTFRNSSMVEIQQGDEVRPGAAIVNIVDTSSMRVRARANQADISHLTAGASTIVRLDGFPDLSFPGTITAIGPLGVNGSFSSTIRTFTVLVSIDGSHPQLMPDLTASVEVSR